MYFFDRGVYIFDVRWLGTYFGHYHREHGFTWICEKIHLLLSGNNTAKRHFECFFYLKKKCWIRFQSSPETNLTYNNYEFKFSKINITKGCYLRIRINVILKCISNNCWKQGCLWALHPVYPPPLPTQLYRIRYMYKQQYFGHNFSIAYFVLNYYLI